MAVTKGTFVMLLLIAQSVSGSPGDGGSTNKIEEIKRRSDSGENWKQKYNTTRGHKDGKDDGLENHVEFSEFLVYFMSFLILTTMIFTFILVWRCRPGRPVSNLQDTQVALLESGKSRSNNISYDDLNSLSSCVGNILFLLAYIAMDLGGEMFWPMMRGMPDHSIQLSTEIEEIPTHFLPDENRVTWWMPFGEDGGCRLPAPQPYPFDFLLGVMKAYAFWWFLGTSHIGCHSLIQGQRTFVNKLRSDEFKFCMLAIYQTATLLWSITMTAYKVLIQMSGKMTRWHTLGCLGLAVNEASWETNALMLMIKYYYKRPFLEVLNEISYDTLDKRKDLVLEKTFKLTLFLWCIFNAVFIFTHMLPGVFIFFQVTAGIGLISCVAYLIFKFALKHCATVGGVEADEELIHASLDQVYYRGNGHLVGRRADEMFQTYFDKKPLAWVPSILVIGIGIQLISAEMVYFYEGDLSYWHCIGYSLSEHQQFGIYFGNFYNTIIADWYKTPWLADLFNQST